MSHELKDMSSPSISIPSSSCKGNKIDTDRDQAYNIWLTEFERKLQSSSNIWQISRKVCIFRVPKPIIMCKQESYVLSIISFGPYHQSNNIELSLIYLHKQEAFRRVLKRLHIGVQGLLAEIQKLESEIRDCYQEPIYLDINSLSYMLALDACFILEFFRGEIGEESFSLIFQPLSNATTAAILCDILKMENQIPISVMLRILELECTTGGHSTMLTDSHDYASTQLARMLITRQVFRGFPFAIALPEDAEAKLKRYMRGRRPPCHLLDMYRMVIRDILIDSTAQQAVNIEPENIRNPVASNVSWSTPRTELLDMAGIKFQPGPLGFRKGRFGTGLLSLPEIRMVDITETLLRNLMAFEECQRCSHSPESTTISHFVKLLDDLMDSDKDVVVLRKSLVVKSHVGTDEEISQIFNGLSYGITVTGFKEIEGVMNQVRDHYGSNWKVLLSEFKNKYFSKPWLVLSLLAGIVLSVSSIVQTVYTVKQSRE